MSDSEKLLLTAIGLGMVALLIRIL